MVNSSLKTIEDMDTYAENSVSPIYYLFLETMGLYFYLYSISCYYYYYNLLTKLCNLSATINTVARLNCPFFFINSINNSSESYLVSLFLFE